MIEAPVRLAPALRRLTAPNPSAFTCTGTQTYLLGGREVTVIDPGPDDDTHRRAILAAVDAARVSAVLVTHNHRDHSPGARPLASLVDAPVLGGPPVAADASYDADYRPDRILADGERVTGDGWSLAVVATPGHTSNHLYFAWREGAALFSGDHAMAWSTSVVLPPDGDMGAYIASLERLAGRDERVYYPGHGNPIDDPPRWLRATLGHRRMREAQIVRLAGEAPRGLAALVAIMYPALGGALTAGAERTVLAHLLDLERRGLARRADEGEWTA